MKVFYEKEDFDSRMTTFCNHVDQEIVRYYDPSKPSYHADNITALQLLLIKRTALTDFDDVLTVHTMNTLMIPDLTAIKTSTRVAMP